jgi:SAM-dependent methyltransferase
MGMHPKFERQDSFVLADALFSEEKLDVVRTLIDKRLISLDNLGAWEKLLTALRIDSPMWFKLIDHIKIRIDGSLSRGGYISEKSPLEIIGNYKVSSLSFNPTFFQYENFKGKTALDFGSGVYRPFSVATILFANGFDRVYSFEPFRLKDDFPYASFMRLINEMLVRPGRFDLSGIGEDEILKRVRSLDLRDLDRSIERLDRREISTIDLGGVLFTNDISLLPAGQIDVHLSNAVLEHVTDIPQLSADLERITAPDGVGYHLVDYLDHRYYDDSSLSPFEKYYDGVLDEINGLTPSELEGLILHGGWNLDKLTLLAVPDEHFAREQRTLIPRYAKYPMAELKQHLNCYQFRRAELAEFVTAQA